MNPSGQPGTAPISLPPEQFAAAFPFHFGLDQRLRLRQVGSTLRRICPDVQLGVSLDQVFRPIRPEGRFTWEWLLDNWRRFFLLEHLASKLQLRGEFVRLPDQATLVFIGSPWFTDTAEIAAHGLGFEDFAIHDPVVDMLQVFQASKMALADAKKLAEKLTAQRTELRTANERLRQQEAESRKLALIAARTDNAVVLTDADGKVVWVNDGFTRLTGYALEEMLGRRPGTVLQGPGTDPHTVEHIRERLQQGEGFSVEILNYGKTGRAYWLAIEVQPIRDEQGRITNFMAVESDITDRRAAQQRLAIQFEVSQALAEAPSFEEAIPRVLQSICKHLDWQSGEFWRLRGDRLSCDELWHTPSLPTPEFQAASRSMTFIRGVGLPGRIWDSGQPVWIQDVTGDPNFPRRAAAAKEGVHGAFGFPVFVRGALRGVLAFYSRNIEEPNETLLKAFSALSNQITQFIVRREAEEALHESNAFQRAILEGANYSIISTSHDGVIRTFNSAAERMLGYTSAEMIDRQTPAIIHDPEEVAARAQELSLELGRRIEPGFDTFIAKAALGMTDEREWTYIRKDRTRFPVLLSVTSLRDETGHVTGYLGIASDITERKRAASELIKAKEEAESASRAKSEFLATMSHEIRTPMNGVLGMTELLLKSHLNSRQKEFAEGIAQSANALLHVIDDVLDFSKIEAGKLTIVSEEFSVRSLVDSVLELVSHRDPEKKLNLAGIIHHDVPPKIQGDPQRVRQVLLNLAGNAVKFTAEGRVTVRVAPAQVSRGPIILRFEVTDTGVGLTEEQMKQLFRPFAQADQSSSRRFGGTGLGLAISRKLVELMGGRIGVRSEPSRGSTFWFELPFVPTTDRSLRLSHPALERASAVIGIRHPTLEESLQETFLAWEVDCVASSTPPELIREVEIVLGQGRTPFIVLEDEFFEEGGIDLRRECARLRDKAFLVLLASPSVAVAREEENGWDLFRSVLLKPAKQSHLFDSLVTAVEGEAAAPMSWAKVVGQQPSTERPQERDQIAKLRILLAEDHHINRKLCLLMLEEFGATADTVENGKEVLTALATHQYDLILMDCNMPEMDGYEATRSIRQLEASRGISPDQRIRIVALTANALIGERERCLGLGMDDFLTKPFTASELRSAILRSAGVRRATRPPPAPSRSTRLDQLVAELDRPSVQLMVQDYINDLSGRLAELNRFHAAGNRDELERAAHSLKGVSAAFGLDDLSAVFRSIEETATAGDLDKAGQILSSLETASDAAIATLRHWLASPEASASS